MKTMLLIAPALILSGMNNTLIAVGMAEETNSPPPPGTQLCRSSHYGFQLAVPVGWTARETDFYVAHYSRIFFTVNSLRPGLEIRDWPRGGSTQEFGGKAAFEQMRPGEVYISICYIGNPGPESVRPDTAGGDLLPMLETNTISSSGQPGLSGLDLTFFKRAHRWEISACLRHPVAEENRRKVIAMLQSFRFADAPVGNASWAESLAWAQLPEQIRGGNLGPSPMAMYEAPGWPVVELDAERTAHATFGSRTVVGSRTGSGFLIKFILQNVGVWEYLVSEEGKVQAKPPVVCAVGPPTSELPTDLPGESQGKLNEHWVAPRVLASGFNITPTVTWFADDGSIKRHVRASEPEAESGFVEIAGPPETIRGINENWEVSLPRQPTDPALAGYITGVPDSRVFVHQRHPKQGLIELDVYLNGKLASAVGPFLQYLGNGVELNEDGSAGLLIWKDESKSTAQIVTVNTNGSVRLRVDCGAAVCSLIIAPGGEGALVHPNTGGSDQNAFVWFTEAGKVRSMHLSPNPYCVGWIPGTRRSLFSTCLGDDDYHFQLIDWETGKQLWNFASPAGGRRPLAIGLTRALVILCVAQPYPVAGPATGDILPDLGEQWLRTFYAFDVQDGNLVSQWQAQFPHRSLETSREHFLRLADKLFYVTAAEVTELNLEDIRSKKHGWH